jgi:hypothetical protein
VVGPSDPAGVTPPEHTLLLAAAAVDHRVTRASLDRALAASPDWTEAVRLALAHRLAPALLAALEAADPAAVPADLLAALRDHCRTLRDDSAALIAEQRALLRDLAAQSVAAIPFKGPLLGAYLFDDAGMRPSRDIDILVRSDDLGRVADVLESRGYVSTTTRPGGEPLTRGQQSMHRRFECEHQFWRASDRSVVEPHWALTPPTHAIDADFDGMFARARPMTLAGESVLMLAPEDLLLALCVHGAKHRWERLVWMRDVAALVARADLDLDACLAHARRHGCARLLLIGLALAQRCARAELPAAVARAIERDRTARELADWACGWLFTPMDYDTHPLRDGRVDRFRLLMRERWPDRARYIVRTCLSPDLGDVRKVALPDGAEWIYFPMRWVTPLWWLARPFVGRNGGDR